jgi:NlpC/P60 family putative phage cell wall peptidase
MATSLANRLVSAAESWIGTRFQHQGRIKGLGVDCVGFISEVAKDAGVSGLEIPNDYRPNEDGTVMLQLLNEHMTLVPTDEMQPGDVLAFCDEALQNPDVPRHLAFVQEVAPNTVFIIHASQHGVRRHRIDAAWRRRIHSTWRIQE